jgi:hypothetical protein
MVKVQVLSIEYPATVLAGVLVALKNVVARELDFLLGEMVVNQQENHPGNTNPEGDSADGFGVGLLLGKIVPFGEAKSLKGPVLAAEDSMRMALKQESQRPPRRANIDCLPKPVQNQNVLVQHRTHDRSDPRPSYTSGL